MVVLVPDPVTVLPPGDTVTVHVPDGGRPFNTTLPVPGPDSGWVMVLITGAEDVAGWALITALPDGTEVHPDALVTVKV